VIFDIVNNFENLYSIGSIKHQEEGMQEIVIYYRDIGGEKNIVNARFRVIDEVQDAEDWFDKLQYTLSASWDTMYEAAKKYFEEHGNLFVPIANKIDNLALGYWIDAQRKAMNEAVSSLLTEERIQKLNAIGMVWENKRAYYWDMYYQAAKSYYEANGNLDLSINYKTQYGLELGKWISTNPYRRAQNQTRNYKDIELKGASERPND